MPILRGRAFGPEERPKQPRSVIIDDSFAIRYFPNQNPIGQHIDNNQTIDPNPPPLTIVGVVPRVRSDVAGRGVRPAASAADVFLRGADGELRKQPARAGEKRRSDPARDRRRARGAKHRSRSTGSGDLDDEDKHFRKPGDPPPNDDACSAPSPALALVLASVGLYGVMALSVTQRTREFGIRLALGAPREDVFRLALGRGLLLVGIGLALGLLGALGAGRALTSLLYNVGSLDPAALLTSIVALAVVALLACWFPARRATRVDPIVALRYE